MNTPEPNDQLPRTNYLFLSLRVLCLFLVSSLPACMGPDLNAVANRLREDNIRQKAQISTLQEQLKNRDATVRDLQLHFAQNNPPMPTLPPERLTDLFTAAKLEIRGQSEFTELPNLPPGTHGFRVFLRTLTVEDQIVPSTGTLTIEAFQLPPAPTPAATAPANPSRLGTWSFTPAEMKKSWYNGLGLNHFAFSCPTDSPTPPSGPIILRATLRDALTGQTLSAQINKTLN